jgi:predicted HTH transcriptional regulator
MGALRVPPFDTSACDGATLANLSRKRIDWFLQTARRERGFPLKANTDTKALLTHLNLLDNGKPTNAAMLLFGTNPQRFHRAAETKCVHCHGTQYRRPFASQQIYSGDLFEQADQARDFVLAKINRGVGTRAASITAPATYELPPDAVGEAIVNAIAHRDYHSNASVEVRLFADRLEVWNPGVLPGTLTLEALRDDHPSVPNNPLIAESLYLTRYIEKAGSGTQRMIELCREASLPEPDFELRTGSFIITLWRDWLTGEVLAGLHLNERQRQALAYLKTHGKISNTEYQEVAKAIKKTATRDLNELKEKGIVEQRGNRGPGVHYVLAKKGDIKGTLGTSA